jgi:hypothetical protein
VLGALLLVIAAGYFLYKVYVSYSSAGGTDFELPVNDGAMFPPVMAVAGLYLILNAYEIDWPWWGYLAIGLVLMLVAWGVIRLSQELGDREL